MLYNHRAIRLFCKRLALIIAVKGGYYPMLRLSTYESPFTPMIKAHPFPNVQLFDLHKQFFYAPPGIQAMHAFNCRSAGERQNDRPDSKTALQPSST